MFYMIETQAIELRHVVIVKSIKDLTPVLPAAHEPQLTQSAQLVRNSRFCHYELTGEIPDVFFTFQQHGNDSQTGRVAQGAEQFSQMGGGVFFEYHNI